MGTKQEEKLVLAGLAGNMGLVRAVMQVSRGRLKRARMQLATCADENDRQDILRRIGFLEADIASLLEDRKRLWRVACLRVALAETCNMANMLKRRIVDKLLGPPDYLVTPYEDSFRYGELVPALQAVVNAIEDLANAIQNEYSEVTLTARLLRSKAPQGDVPQSDAPLDEEALALWCMLIERRGEMAENGELAHESE